MRILLVEDDELLGKALETRLKQSSYTPEWVKDGESAYIASSNNDFGAIILDINLPKLSGLEVLRNIRKTSSSVPIIIMTARGGLSQRVEGLDLGADDYIVKPFEFDDLLARIRAVVRRSQGRSGSIIIWKDVEVDTSARRVKKNGKWIKFTAQEYQVLALLLERAGKFITKSEIESQIYGWDGEFESNTIEVIIYSIRKKLGKEIITTVRGVGYMVNT